MNAHDCSVSNSVLRHMFFDDSSTQDFLKDRLYSLMRAVHRRACQLTHLLTLTADELLVAPTLCVANVRSDCDRAGGLDLKWHMGKPGAFNQPPDRFIHTRNQADIDADDKRKAVPNLIANINHCLWTKRAPTTAV